MRRVVVFHGWSNTVEPHDFIMQGFKKIPGELFFPQGPIPVPEDRFVDFCRKHGTSEEVIAAVSKLPHFQWWDTFRPGEPSGPDDLKDSLTFFESMFKEIYGEFKFRKAMQVIEEHPGDLY